MTTPLSRIAGDIFIKASGEYQAMAIAQAVRIQLLSREAQADVDELLIALLDDEQEILRVTTIANNAHSEALKHATKDQHIPVHIGTPSTLQVIRPVFALAIVLQEYKTEHLQHVLNVFYQEFLAEKQTYGKHAAEKRFNRKAMLFFALNLDTIHLLQLVQTDSSSGLSQVESTNEDSPSPDQEAQ